MLKSNLSNYFFLQLTTNHSITIDTTILSSTAFFINSPSIQIHDSLTPLLVVEAVEVA